MTRSFAARLTPVVILLAGCMDPLVAVGPGAPPPYVPPPPTAPPPPGEPTPTIGPPPPFPALAGSGVIYRAPDSLYDAYVATHGSQLGSRYVLYEDNKFSLQFSSARWGFFEYTGAYTRAGTELGFGFAADGRWTAEGTLLGDTLVVKYSFIASMSDFIDGPYILSTD